MNSATATIVVQNLIPQLAGWWTPLTYIGYSIGLLIFVGGLAGIASQGKSQGHIKGPLYAMLAGLVLVNLMAFVDIGAQSIFAQASATGLDTSISGSDPTSLYQRFAVNLVQLVGICGFIQGCILLKRSGEDGQHVFPAITHLVGGTLAINIMQTLNMLASSMGISLNSLMGG